MKYRAARSFQRDLKRLSDADQALFLQVIHRQFHPACVRFASEPTTAWPRGLRVKRVQGAPGIWEMTWSFAGSDGRATFEWTEVDGDLAVRWRRIGGHEIFDRP